MRLTKIYCLICLLSRISQTRKQPKTLCFPVGDKRHLRRGQTRCSWGQMGGSSGTKDNILFVNWLQKHLTKKDERHRKGGLYDFLETSTTSYQRPVVSPQRHRPVETQELANRIARESTVSPADTHAVLRALPNIMADFMKESRAVHFEGLGWFRYTTVSAGNGVATKEEVSSDQITGLRVQFTPDRTRNMSGGYTRALIADEGITFMEWLGRESDETKVPENDDDEGQTENPLG